MTNSTILLFTLIAFWSRLPGVGIRSPLYILYNSDLVDIFAMLIAINIGGFQAGIFQAVCNLASRATGVTPRWIGVGKDVVAQFVACMMIPFVHAITGDILQSIIIYGIIRWFMFIPLKFVDPQPRPWVDTIALLTANSLATIVINSFYAKLFGDFFNNLLKTGVRFNWILFLFATLIISIVWTLMFSTSKKEKKRSLVKTLAKKAIKKTQNRMQNNHKYLNEKYRPVQRAQQDEIQQFSEIKDSINNTQQRPEQTFTRFSFQEDNEN